MTDVLAAVPTEATSTVRAGLFRATDVGPAVVIRAVGIVRVSSIVGRVAVVVGGIGGVVIAVHAGVICVIGHIASVVVNVMVGGGVVGHVVCVAVVFGGGVVGGERLGVDQDKQ
ncbi:hypothetical protein, partial [Planotetraspora thailandica]|uniref:hypothetical protein n=1 Tax=Planotetraspora thailandica TaxID=487172 RepID=UPI00194EFCA0